MHQLVLLVPGATTRPGGFEQTVGAATGSLGSGVAIGGRDNQNNFTLDGASNNARQFGNIAIKPSVDSIQEFKVLTNSYSAEMGQAAFGQISLITKSGTNTLHGTLFEFWRNDIFDARNFFLPKVSRLNRNQFGGAAGGPVVRNRLFFFFNYEANRERRGVELTRSVPIQAWRDGDFSGIAGLTLRDPQSQLPFPGNRIPGCAILQDCDRGARALAQAELRRPAGDDQQQPAGHQPQPLLGQSTHRKRRLGAVRQGPRQRPLHPRRAQSNYDRQPVAGL